MDNRLFATYTDQNIEACSMYWRGSVQDGGRGKGSFVFIPEDLQEALAQKPGAKEYFDSLSDHLRYLHVKYVSEVVEQPARGLRIQEILELLDKNSR